VPKLPPRARFQAEDGDDVVDLPTPKLPRTRPGGVCRVGNPTLQSTGRSGVEEHSSRHPRRPANSTPPGTSRHPVPSVDNHIPASPAEALISPRRCRQTANAADDEETVDGRDLVIEKVFPNRGPTSGGTEVCIWGSNFPTDHHLPLYARFGDNFARAVSMLSPSFGKYLTVSRFFKCLTCSCAVSRQLMFQARLQ